MPLLLSSKESKAMLLGERHDNPIFSDLGSVPVWWDRQKRISTRFQGVIHSGIFSFTQDRDGSKHKMNWERQQAKRAQEFESMSLKSNYSICIIIIYALGIFVSILQVFRELFLKLLALMFRVWREMKQIINNFLMIVSDEYWKSDITRRPFISIWRIRISDFVHLLA